MSIKKIFTGASPSNAGNIARASTIGLHLVSGIAVGAFLGYLLDKWFLTGPYFFIGFAILGVFAGFRNMYLDVKLLIKEQYKDNDQNGQDNLPKN